MRFELHCHTEHSHDGFTSLEGLLAECRRRGIDGVAITEHDGFHLTEADGRRAREQGVFLIPAAEVTTDKGVHLIGLFLERLPKSAPLAEVVAEIRSQGGLVSIPHPFKPDSGLLGNAHSTESEVACALAAATFVEVANGGFDLAPFRERIVQLAEQYGLIGVAASDCHKQWQVGAYLTELDVARPESLEELKTRMAGAKARLLVRSDFRSAPAKRSGLRKVRYSGFYQALVAALPWALKRAIKVQKYRWDLERYQPPGSIDYQEVI